MKSFFRLSVLLFGFFGLVLTLSACDLDSFPYTNSDSEPTSEVADVNVVLGSVQNAYVTDDFNPSTIQLEVTMDDDSKKYVALEESFLSNDSLVLLDTAGTKTLEGVYQNQAYSFEITLVEDSRALLLNTIHTLGVADAALEDDYETWRESIEGVSVDGVYFNDLDELVFDLSDGSTINVGTIPVTREMLPDTLIESARIENGSNLVLTYTDGSEEALDLGYDIHTVQFKTPDGAVYDVQILKDNAPITYANPPEITGYVFDGYSSEPDEATSSIKIDAYYAPKDITLTFDTSDGTPQSVTQPFGTDIAFPSPTNTGYEFMGWYLDTDYNVPFASSTMPSQDRILYAKWVDFSTGETLDNTQDAVTMVENIKSSIVGVVNTISDTEGGTGSGVVYKDNGDGSYNMITNYHVIENYSSLQIVYEFYNNYYIVEDENVAVLGTYAETDIAIIQFTPAESLDTITIADSYDVKTGERVYALGSPQGNNYIGSVTEGIVGSASRFINEEGGIKAMFIQHDAAISPGNSGGALVNAQGELIGMNTLKLADVDVEGMGFALASNTISRMIEDIEANGSVSRTILGVTMSDSAQCVADYGACIDSITVGSTAETIGLQPGDSVIGYKTEVMDDFRDIYNSNYLYEAVLNTLPGTEIILSYDRSGNTLTSDLIVIN
jgi:serine protease Do